MVDALLIQTPTFNFGTFLSVLHGALGYSPATASDASSRKLSDVERFLSCLAAVRDPDASCGFEGGLLAHASFSILLAAPDVGMLDILSYASGMPFVVVPTISRGVSIAVITGTLAQWKDAIATGLASGSSARECYTKLYALFIDEGLNVWSDYRVSSKDQYLLLTYHPV